MAEVKGGGREERKILGSPLGMEGGKRGPCKPSALGPGKTARSRGYLS